MMTTCPNLHKNVLNMCECTCIFSEISTFCMVIFSAVEMTFVSKSLKN